MQYCNDNLLLNKLVWASVHLFEFVYNIFNVTTAFQWFSKPLETYEKWITDNIH